MGIDTVLREEARGLRARLIAAPSAALIEELARIGLGDLATCERHGGDAVGTDAYPAVRDGWRDYVALLAHAEPGVRAAAGWLLAFLVEPADQVLPALDAAAAAEPDEATRAGLVVAAARLRATVSAPVEVPWDGIELAPAARDASPAIRAAIAIGQVFGLPSFPRKVTAEISAALDAIAGAGVAAGPWGGGDLGALAAALRRTLWVQGPKEAPAVTARDAAPDDDDDVGDDGEDIGDAEVADPYTQQRPRRAPPRIALPGLRDVDWAALEHAYGPATGVPGMIDALSSPDEADRVWALDALAASIHHQGSVYSASTAAVPFLIALAGEPMIEVRAAILRLLCGIAVHQPEGCLVNGALQWRSEAYDAVLAGGPTYVRLLADPDPAVRAAAAYALSYLAPPAPGAIEAARAALDREHDRRARSSLLLALGYLSRYAQATDDRDRLVAWLDDDCPLIRASAAIALVQMDGADASARARAVLDEVGRGAPRVHGAWPWAEGNLARFATVVRQSIKTIDEVLADFDRATADGDARARQVAANKALGMLFRGDAHDIDRLWRPDELDAPRRAILRYLVETAPPDSGRRLVGPWELLADVGLPYATDALARFLGDGAGPVDAVVTVGGEARPAWQWIHAALIGAADRAAVLAALTAGSPAERVALVDDALDAPHWVWSPRRPTEYGVPGGPERSNDFTSRCVLLLADVLAAAGEPGLARARAIAAAEAAKGDKRSPVPATLAAVVLARAAAARGEAPDPSIDALVALDRAPASTYRLALREVFAHLPAERCLRIAGGHGLWGYTAYRDPRGEVRRWKAGPGWAYLDLLPPAFAVARVLEAIREWERHRGAGDDRDAAPVAGSVESSLDSRPGDDEAFPRDRALDVLASGGAAAIALIDAALADGTIADRALLDDARRRAAP